LELLKLSSIDGFGSDAVSSPLHSIRLQRPVLPVLGRAWARRLYERRGLGFGGIVPGAKAQRDQRERIDLAGTLQVLLALKSFEGVAATRPPRPACVLRLQVALRHQRLLNLLVTLRRWSHLARPPRRYR